MPTRFLHKPILLNIRVAGTILASSSATIMPIIYTDSLCQFGTIHTCSETVKAHE